MSKTEVLIIKMLSRLYWTITQAPGVIRYAFDVELFANADVLIGHCTREDADRSIAGYKKDE